MAMPVRSLLRINCVNYSQLVYYCSAAKARRGLSASREGRMMGKLLAANLRERKQWNKGLPTTNIMDSANLSPHRLNALNRIFMSTITDCLTTSKHAEDLSNHGLLVSEVQLSKCGRILTVLWSSQSAESDITIAKILDGCVNELRSSMVGQNVSGFVPRIVFLKDEAATLAREVEHILNTPKVQQDLKSEDNEENSAAEEEVGETLLFVTEMSSNIIGLKRDDILRRINATGKKFATMKQEEAENAAICYDIEAKLRDPRLQKMAITSYIAKQKKIEKDIYLETLGNIKERSMRGRVQDDDLELDDTSCEIEEDDFLDDHEDYTEDNDLLRNDDHGYKR